MPCDIWPTLQAGAACRMSSPSLDVPAIAAMVRGIETLDEIDAVCRILADHRLVLYRQQKRIDSAPGPSMRIAYANPARQNQGPG